jgi:hypothetical protein
MAGLASKRQYHDILGVNAHPRMTVMTPALHGASCPVTVAGLATRACGNRHSHQAAGPWESSEAGCSRRPSRAANRNGLALIFSVLGIFLSLASRVNEKKHSEPRVAASQVPLYLAEGPPRA